MAKIKIYDNDEEMFAELARLGRLSDELGREEMKGWGKLINTGTKFLRVEGGLVIWGEVIESPYEEDREALARTPWVKLVKAASVMCPTPEMGTAHVATIQAIITDEQFEAGREKGWPSDPETVYSIIPSLKVNQ